MTFEDNIEEIEKLISKLKKVYTLTPSKYEEALALKVLDLLEENLDMFDDNGNGK